ncbi:MAG: tetratricopeptide repeat protein [candidate division WOR-3 bacterium]|nr:MAG: tetratricopeptide repeat protein [candidate division WOR-3 bacterium]
MACSFLLYLPTLGHDLVWDDTSLISENLLLAGSSPLDLLGREFWAGSPGDPGETARSFYRPLTVFSFWLDQRVAGTNPAWFHLVNILLNAGVAALVTLLIWDLLGSAVWAGLGGLLFGAHSSHVESVAFVSGRTDLLAGLLVLAAALGLVRSLRPNRFVWAWLVVTAFPLALLSKETAIVFPILVALAPPLVQTGYTRRHWLLAAATASLGLGYLVLRSRVLGAMLPRPDLGAPVARLFEVGNTLGLYLGMFFWPLGHHQVKFPADPSFTGPTAYVVLALVFVAALPLAAVRHRLRVALFGGAWTFLFLLPVLNVVRIGPQAAERLIYLPSAGLVLVVITLLVSLTGVSRALGRTAVASSLVMTFVLGVDAFNRSRVWRDEGTLFAAMAAEAPTAPSAYANLANTVRFKDPDSAITLYRKTLEFDPGYSAAHLNLGVLLSQQGTHDSAIHHLNTAVVLDAGSVKALNNLGLAFFTAGMPESALVYFNKSVAIDSGLAATHLNLAGALAELGRNSRADAELHRALEIEPGLTPAHLMLAERYERIGLLDSAIWHMHRAEASDPTRPSLANRLGTMLVRAGDTAAAMASYQRALELDSCLVPALYNQAVLLAAGQDTAQALELATRAHRLRPDLTAVSSLYDQLSR